MQSPVTTPGLLVVLGRGCLRWCSLKVALPDLAESVLLEGEVRFIEPRETKQQPLPYLRLCNGFLWSEYPELQPGSGAWQYP